MRKIEKAFSHINLQRKWEKKGTINWKDDIRNDEIVTAPPYPVETYSKLIDAVAQISFYNRDYILFFRGQDKEYLNDSDESLIYPTIYRQYDNNDLKQLWDKLNETDELIKNHFRSDPHKFAGTDIFLKYKELRWAIMQHYTLEKTPVLDITHSLHVASSFAQHKNKSDRGIIYVLGMPSFSNTVSIYTEEELMLIRLLSFCLPKAKRPYIQEAYAVGPYPDYRLDDDAYLSKYNFSKRLIAKFSIPVSDDFWEDNLSRIPGNLLESENDSIQKFLDVFQIDFNGIWDGTIKFK